MEIKIHFSDEEETKLKKAAGKVTLESYCKATIMWRVEQENIGIFPIPVYQKNG